MYECYSIESVRQKHYILLFCITEDSVKGQSFFYYFVLGKFQVKYMVG